MDNGTFPPNAQKQTKPSLLGGLPHPLRAWNRTCEPWMKKPHWPPATIKRFLGKLSP